MRTFRAGGMAVAAQLVVAALVVSSCSGGSSTGGRPAGTIGAGPSTSTSASPAQPSTGTSSAAVPVNGAQLLTAGDLTRAGIASRFDEVPQSRTASAADQRKVFDCLAVTTVLAPVRGARADGKGVRAFTDQRKVHDVAQVVLHFASPAAAQRFGGAVARRLFACPHPKLLVAGTGPEVSNGSVEQVSTRCDRSLGFAAIATRQSAGGAHSLVVGMLLVDAGQNFSLVLLVGPLSSNNPTQRSKVADAVCAHLRG